VKLKKLAKLSFPREAQRVLAKKETPCLSREFFCNYSVDFWC
jgi:hypothetical protein